MFSSPFLNQCFVTLGVSLGMVSGSQVMTFCYVLLPQLNAISPLGDERASWIVAINGISLPIGLLLAAPLMNKYGRRATNIVRAVLTTASWTCLSMTTNFYVILFFRFLQGICLGFAAILVPILIGEYTSPKYRGACLTTTPISISIGVLSIHTLSSFSWHSISIICAAISFVNIIIIVFSPESPSYLASKGLHDECRRTFKWLRYPNENKELEKMIQTQIASVEEKEKKRDTLKKMKDFLKMWQKKEIYKPLFLMFHLHIINEWCAANVYDAFTTYIYKRMIGDMEVSFLISTDLLRALSGLCAIIVARKLRRRLMLLITVSLNIVSLSLMSLHVYARTVSVSYDHPYIGVVLIHFYVFSFSSGCLVLPNILAGEIFPLQHRGVCQLISQLFFSVNLIINMKTALQMFTALDLHGALIVYAGLVAYGLIASMLILPETKDKTLQEIEEEFRGIPRDREILNNLLIHNPDIRCR